MTITITGARKLTPAQVAAMRRAERAVDAAYPGQDVAYIEEWDGDDVEWRVVAAAAHAADFHNLLKTLDPETRRRVQLTRIPPADVFEVRSTFVV
ncbi:MAG TPA: hypothetical protein VMZ71_11240 [Gemmataceae bacterium]|nr:hypothetical protein [Gemmataceae bacterium]